MAIPLPLRMSGDDALGYMVLAGAGVAALAWAWLVALAFRTRWTWGAGCLVFPPLVLAFAPSFPRRTWKAALVLGLGVALVAFPVLYTRLVPVDLGPIDRMVDGERHLTLTGWDRKDYRVLRSRSDVVVLQMANPDVTDATLEELRPLASLRELDLNGTAVTDAGLSALRDLPRLEVLRLKGTKITDAGFAAALAGKEGLRMVELTGTGVSREAVKAWKAARPGRRALQ